MTHLNPAKVANALGVGFDVRVADPASVSTVFNANEHDDEGRSQWLWIWCPNGDLILGCYPQGDTYFATEGDHSA